MKAPTIESVDLSPSPVCLIESLRDIGYSMETAIADLVDNSLTAGAKTIWIRSSWNNGNPWLAVLDDGSGMSRDELIAAMRFGSMSPLEERASDDLGRFGLGMKTASFSQCRHLTVYSRQDGEAACCEWDLAKVADDSEGRWLLRIINEQELSQQVEFQSLFNEYQVESRSGTIVLWRDLDRIDSKESDAKRQVIFNSLLEDVRNHLELVFHRYLAPRRKQGKVSILMNGDELCPLNPFNPRHPATQELPEQKIQVAGQVVKIQPYVLPHHSKVSKEEYDRYAGERGYLHNQGFYVYRNKRLIISGTWFRLLKKQELTKLIRVRVDIPNTLDHLWGIDVKKSHAAPPERVRTQLRKIIDKIELSGTRVYRQRGKKLSSKVKVPAWNRIAKGGGIKYEVNREHPLYSILLTRMKPSDKALLKDMVNSIEQSFPVAQFYADIAEKPDQVTTGDIDKDTFAEALERFLAVWCPEGGVTKAIVEQLLTMEPFATNSDLSRAILTEKGYI